MDAQDTEHFTRQLEELSRQSQQEAYRMGSLSADLTAQRYLLDNIRNQIFELQQAKQAVAQEVLMLIGPSHTPPPLPRADDVDAFVGRIAERFKPQPDPHPLDPYDIGSWAYAKRAAE